MLFKNKKQKCPNCKSKISDNYSFCPYCGDDLIDREQELKDFGMLGKDDYDNKIDDQHFTQNFGITDKLIGSLVNSLAKNLDKQFRDMEKDFSKNLDTTEIKSLPNGIKIKIGYPGKNSKQPRTVRKSVTPIQIQKMSELPRTEAKSSVKRINNKVIYELTTPGVETPQDVFVSKLESGYEVKAIGEKKVYVNSLPINLPLNRLSLAKDKLLVEFKTTE